MKRKGMSSINIINNYIILIPTIVYVQIKNKNKEKTFNKC